jgi:TRAP-type C4-dicarboxylate transport system permease small subunit
MKYLQFLASQKDSLCQGATGNATCTTTGPTLMETIGTISDVLIYILGAVAVIMIIIGGFRYATSNGDQNTITGAKNTIMYAIIGIIVAVLAYAIVKFVVDNIA